MRALLPLVSLLLAWSEGTRASDPTLPFMEYLDEGHLVCLKWGFDNLKEEITFKLVVNSTGWVSFGLSPSGGMAGSDIVMGGLDSGTSYFTDRHATGNSMPKVDEQQSYTLLSMAEEEGQTIMAFKRPFQTCDDQDLPITAQPIKLIYAYGITDEIGYHGAHRGTKEVNLLNYEQRTMLTNSDYITIKMDNITLPPTTTSYYCKIMTLPRFTTKHHIYMTEPIIENHDVVHHMVLYRCPPSVTEPYEGDCSKSQSGIYCLGVVASWAVGGRPFELPGNAGISIGGMGNDTLYKLEIHYNNPAKRPGITDSSGLKLYYTSQLRQHDVGILTTGVLSLGGLQYSIPPKAKQFHTYGICKTAHFSQFVKPVPNLEVFAVLLHTHLAGRKVRVGHFRNGKLVDFLGLNENYDFEMQQIVTLGSIKTIQPGDEITVECTYNTEDRIEDTKDEMCLAFLFYYPEIKIANCISHPNTSMISVNEEPTGESDQDEIAEHEMLLKTLPQIQIVSDDNSTVNIFTDSVGIVNEMMKTPAAACKITNASNRLRAFWIVNYAGIVLLLTRIGIL
ncbi:DBH-like monooxygenase protein 2 homolog [Mugil cephalus]|uniref:DBH-like monooxygenase protein 2 homolog n=1 Tax=Mugil cephalus TaxID=48193 RepID=UPI001FB6147E|nr:DBH-like monooxygenase protein 2 homolog [Mugil cephalus]